MPATGRSQFGQIVIDLREIPQEVRKELRPRLQAAGQAVAQDARGRSSWSKRIPGAITVKVLYGRVSGVVIRVSRKRAPHARAYEGIGARKGNASSFRHPFFGNRDRWYEQKTRPFLHPAAQAKRTKVRAEIARVVEDAARRHGFN